MNEFETITLARDEGKVRLTLSRPDARNAVSLQMCHELRDCFEGLSADADVRVISIAGAGRVFCAGADLKERKGRDEAWVRKRRLAAYAAYDAIARCPVPVFTLVHGAAIGSGGEIALASDFVVAASDAIFRFPEPQWGTVGATQRLQRAIGKSGAKELLFTGRDMSASEALACGLVQRMVAPEELYREGERIAAAIAKAPALAIRLTKQSVELGSRTDLDAGLRVELAAIDQNLASGDWRRGQDDFAESTRSRKLND